MNKLSLDSFKGSMPPAPSEVHTPVMVRLRILIVCEGTVTEKNYFESFPAMTAGTVLEIDCQGTATNTIRVVNKAIEMARKSKKPYDSVWAVYDKDSFKDADFDNAIARARANNVRCAWSNEAFELWYVLHFEYRNTPMSRKDYRDCITGHLSPKVPGYKYEKNDSRTYGHLQAHGDEKLACRRARKLASAHAGRSPHACNPATTVYELVEFLRGGSKEFNSLVKARLAAQEAEGETKKTRRKNKKNQK